MNSSSASASDHDSEQTPIYNFFVDLNTRLYIDPKYAKPSLRNKTAEQINKTTEKIISAPGYDPGDWVQEHQKFCIENAESIIGTEIINIVKYIKSENCNKIPDEWWTYTCAKIPHLVRHLIKIKPHLRFLECNFLLHELQEK